MFAPLVLISLISIVFGVLVFVQPEIISYLVASFFVLAGLIGLFVAGQAKSFWNRINK